MVQSKLSDLQVLAVSKAGDDKAYKASSKATTPGEYPVDVTVRIHGKIVKGEDVEKEVPSAIKWEKLFSIVANKVNNETLDAALAEYKEADEAGTLDDVKEELKTRVNRKVASLIKTTKRTTAGAVRADLEVDVIG